MADITFGHRAEHAPPASMDHPGQWHYVATRLMAHMGAYSLDKMNWLHWLWHPRAALRIRTAMQRQNIWAIPGSPGYQGHAPVPQRPRSQEVPQPPRQAAQHNSPGRHQQPPSGLDSPSGTYRSPLRPFAPRRDRGSPHTPGVHGNTPERHQETRNPGRSRRPSRTPPPAARRVVFHPSCTKAWTEAMEVPTTPTPNGHCLPPISHASPRGPAPSGHRSPSFRRQLSERDRQRSAHTPSRQQTV